MELIGALLGLIFLLVIVGVIFWGIQQILALAPIAETFKTIINVVLIVAGVLIAVLVCIWLLNLAGLHVQMPNLK